MSENLKKPDTLYHFTSPIGLAAIIQSGHISLSESNLNIRDGNCDVVWLTSSPDSKNHGLKFDDSIPDQYDKCSIRISLPYNESCKYWDEWSDSKGMNKEYKDILINSANARETYKTWYISESVILIENILKIENMVTGEIMSAREATQSLPKNKMPEAKFLNEIDEYIASQPSNLQVLLLSVRKAIKQALPEDVVEKISWKMPTFWKGGNLIHFAAQKNHLGIYPGAETIKYFTPRLTGYKTSKGAIQFPYKTFGAEQMKLITEIAAWCGEKNAKT